MTMPDVVGAPPPDVVAAPRVVGAYTTRILPPEEWDRLRALPFGSQGLPDPDLAIVLVDETAQGEIVGIWAVMLQPMLDGLWVHPDHRQVATRTGSVVAGQLLQAMRTLLQQHGILRAFTMIEDSAVMVLAHKAGFTRAPGDLWILHLPTPDPEPEEAA